MRKHEYKIVDEAKDLLIEQGGYSECRDTFIQLQDERRFKGYAWDVQQDTATLREMHTGEVIQVLKIKDVK